MGILIGTEKRYDVSYMHRKLDEWYDKWGVIINIDKTEHIVVCGDCRDTSKKQCSK